MKQKTAVLMVLGTALLAGLGSLLLWMPDAIAAETAGASPIAPEVLQWGYMAAALATGLSSLGAAYAVANVGAAA